MKKFIPKFILSWYHLCLAYLGAALYGWPSRKMIVIGVTGTKGKTTTCNLIAQLLELAGKKVGLATTVNFKVGDREWINSEKQTMLGRFKLQKLLARMKNAGCQYAVVETSSEGILQHRHRGIDYDVAVFTNLSPEHIERHGSFEKYRQAKEKLFAVVAKKKNGVGVYNLDDEHVEYFWRYKIKNKYGYKLSAKLKVQNSKQQLKTQNFKEIFEIEDIRLNSGQAEFEINGVHFKTKLIGEMNVYNLAAAISVAVSQKLKIKDLSAWVARLKAPAGRMQVIDEGQNFVVIVDYAHEPASLQAAYQTARLFGPRKIIGLLGAQGGGRDQGKRSKLGEIAANYADYVFVTNEDPYDEDPRRIIEDVSSGVVNKPVEKIIDRAEAIKKALALAQEGDLVLITGKGGEVLMCVENGRKIPWSDEETVRQILRQKKNRNCHCEPEVAEGEAISF